MFWITRNYVSVFDPTMKFDISEKMVFAKLSTSKKNTNQDGKTEYVNMRWMARFVGEAFEPAKALRNGDKVDIIKGIITNRYDKEKKTQYVSVVIFEFGMSDLNKEDKEVALTDCILADLVEEELPF